MQRFSILSFLCISFFLITLSSGCKKDVAGCLDPEATNYNPDATISSGTCEYIGSVAFWQSGTPSYDVTTVTLNGSSSSITVDLATGPADCTTSGVARFTLEPGTYTYVAEEEGLLGETWSGSVTITINGCLLVQLL